MSVVWYVDLFASSVYVSEFVQGYVCKQVHVRVYVKVGVKSGCEKWGCMQM